MKQAVLSISGGLDSSSLLLHLLANDVKVTALSFYYGQKHSVELERVKANLAYLKENGINVDHHIVDLSSIMSTFGSALTSSDIAVPEGHYAEDNMKATVVPNRNAIFMSIIYGKALSIANETGQETLISLGIHSGDHAIYPDCRGEFRDAIFKAFEMGNWGSDKVLIYTPYLTGDKHTILQDALLSAQRLGLDFNTLLGNTNTCYHPDVLGRSCGKCGSCVERVEAFVKLGVQDPVPYQEDWKLVVGDVIDTLKSKG